MPNKPYAPTVCGEDGQGNHGILPDYPRWTEFDHFDDKIHPDLKGDFPEWLLRFIKHATEHPLSKVIDLKNPEAIGEPSGAAAGGGGAAGSGAN